MGKNKKPFIDKKKAVRFQLVHRGQRDPLQADADAPERVLHQIGEKQKGKKEERTEYGIHFNDDEYDYMQHLKPRGEGTLVLAEETQSDVAQKPVFKDVGGIRLPADILPSEYEEDEGMLGKGVLPRGPQPDWDPDIVEALDDGVDLDDPENILEDDFMMMANAPCSDAERDIAHNMLRFDEEEEEYSDRDFDSDDCDLASAESGSNFDQEETKSRFTSYSMTSSVIRRTEGLKLLDDCFERVMEEYDDENVGGLDEDDMDGVLTQENPLVNQVIDEVNEQQEKTRYPDSQPTGRVHFFEEEIDGEPADVQTEDFERLQEPEKEKWDCESIISTYSNIYHHPTVISEPGNRKPIQLTKNLAIPVNIFKKKGENTRKEEMDVPVEETQQIILNRPKNETKEEKKIRKLTVKEGKRERRVEKKANKLAFRDEHKIQEKVFASQPVKSNLTI